MLRPRLLLTLLALALVAAVPARADTVPPQTFTGSFAPACGTNPFTLASASTIAVTVTADVPTNDIAVSLVHDGAVVASTDTGVGQEALAYSAPAGGSYVVQVCTSTNPLVTIVPPTTYHGVFSAADIPALPGLPPGSGATPPTAAPQPTYTAWDARFAPATVVDPQRTEGEPLNFLAPDGSYWESGPYGTTTQNSFIHRSTDGGLTFHLVSPTQTRPDAPPGGGDTDVAVDDQGYVYFDDLEGLVNLGASVSNDSGNTWRKNPAAVQNAAVDRQWYAIDNGTSAGAGDNTVFLAFHQTGSGTYIYSSPGSTGSTDPVGGLVFQNSATLPGPLQPLAGDATCAQLRFDPVKRNLYYACNEDDHIRITVGHVEVGQRTGITYTNHVAPKTPGGGSVLSLFPALATDAAGNVYVAWIDKTNGNEYYSYSTDEGVTWSQPVQVNQPPSVTNEFTWAQGGAAGNVAIGWYGTEASTGSGGPDALPSYKNDPGGATKYPWYGYAALVTGANTLRPTIAQTRFTEKPMHYGQVCNGGIGCTATGGDRQMADYFGFRLAPDGAMRIVYNDTTNDFDGAGLFEARQVAGSTALGTTLGGSLPANPMSDATGDAQWPHYGVPGPNQPQLDLTKVQLSQPNRETLRVELSVADLATQLPPPGKASAVWLARFQALSPRPGGSEQVYRIFYAGAETTAGALPQFFAGVATCQQTDPGNCKLFEYPDSQTVGGQIAGNTITVDVPLAGGFGAPVQGSTLYNVTGLALGRNGPADLYADVDEAPSFDFALGGPTTGATVLRASRGGGGGAGGSAGGSAGANTGGFVAGVRGRRIRGYGYLPHGRKRRGYVQLDVTGAGRGRVRYVDRRGHVSVATSRITYVGFADRAHSAKVVGTFRQAKKLRRFTVIVVDYKAVGKHKRAGAKGDIFRISLSTGYGRKGRILGGNISIR